MARAANDGHEKLSRLLWASQYGDWYVLKMIAEDEKNSPINEFSESGQSALFVAANAGQLESVCILLQHGASVDLTSPKVQFQTPLIAAAKNGFYAIVRVLLEHGADVHAAMTNGTTALIAAGKSHHNKIVTTLLNSGADVNAATKTHFNALHFAVLSANLPLAQLLLDYNANVNANPDAMTPLLIAVQHQNIEMAKLLLYYGANPNLIVKEHGLSPIQYAWCKGYVGIAMLLRHMAPLHFSIRTTRMGLVERLMYRHINTQADEDVFLSFADRNDTTAILFTAVHCNNIKFVQRLLSRGVDPNVPSKAGFTALLLAVARNLHDIAKELLEANADTELSNDAGVVPLWAAYNNNDPQMFQLLLDYMADPNSTFMGGTLFILAIKQRRIYILELLLRTKEVDINQTDNNGRTGFEYACLHQDLECVKLLVKFGISKTTSDGKTLLMFAAKHGSLPIVQYLLPISDINALSENGYSAVAVAAYYGHLDVVKFLALHGANLNQVTDNAVFPLRIAAQEGHTEVVRYLVPLLNDVDRRNCYGDTALYMATQNQHIEVVKCLSSKANVNLSMEDGSTSLSRACLDGNVDIVDILIQNGADVNMPSFDGNRPLVIAAEKGHYTVVKRLLAEVDKINVNVQNQEGKTALYQASCFGHFEICKALLRAKADVTISTSKGVVPIVIAIVVQNIDIIQLLLPHIQINAPLLGSTLLHMAIQRRSRAIVDILINHGADVNALAEDGRSPLVLAAHMGCLDIVQALLLKVSDVDAPFQGGYTALSVAVEQGHLPVVQTLISRKANVLQTTQIGLTLLHLSCFSGWCDIATYLLSLGADVNKVDKVGGRSITYAVSNGHAQVVQILMPLVDINAMELSTKEVLAVPHASKKLQKDIKNGFHLLHLASSQNHPDTLAILLQSPKINVNVTDKNYAMSALHIACACGHLDVLKQLLCHYNVDINLKDKDGNTPLHFACQYGRMNVILYLLQWPGVNRTVENKNGLTCFHTACIEGHIDIASLLCQEHELAVYIIMSYFATSSR
ncbi:hypothetical protein THRCLA_11235 [Thraustotheca clavata]|uniref:Uncharacterized protein n=1 Tax=Thraustotheca clavata TaxID=74557 RepID=A0A1V9Y8D0_9STRA|nr:hypothetical protein THRCLA_11235 [Thraustotheca clavata]